MTERSSEGLDPRRRRLLFRAWRRGVREMDLIIGRFADAHIEAFDESGLDELAKLRSFHTRAKQIAAGEKH
jgi:antitoxin CptB